MTAEQLKALIAWLESEIMPALAGRMPPDLTSHHLWSLRSDKFRDVLRAVKACKELESAVREHMYIDFWIDGDGLVEIEDCEFRGRKFGGTGSTVIDAIECAVEP